jgi:hypothetical protein
VARFDRVIPPGGTGSVILTVDTERILGEFAKRATVWSNDPERQSIDLELTGEVRPYISLDPGGYVSLWGPQGEVPTAYVDIINNSERPLEIESIHPDDDLKDLVKWRLERVKPGFAYRLVIEDVSQGRKGYTGHLIVRTNHPEKPVLSVIVNRQVSEER